MNALIEAIDDLAATMQETVSGSATQTQVLGLLERLQSNARSQSRLTSLAPDMEQLHHLWTHSIDWCSHLSRQLERIIILYQEAVQTDPKVPPPNQKPF